MREVAEIVQYHPLNRTAFFDCDPHSGCQLLEGQIEVEVLAGVASLGKHAEVGITDIDPRDQMRTVKTL